MKRSASELYLTKSLLSTIRKSAGVNLQNSKGGEERARAYFPEQWLVIERMVLLNTMYGIQ